jgi:large-conductance mechanosensitive channel
MQFFMNAQINVTTWYLNYLDCRLKKLSFGAYNILKTLSSKTETTLVMNDELLDLGPGEIASENKFLKYQCYRLTSGSIISSKGCLIYKLGAKTYNISNTGEVVERPECRSSLRLNSTHIISGSVEDLVAIQEFSYPSLREEEEILNYPPKTPSSDIYVSELLRNSSLNNVWKDKTASSGNVQQSSSGSFSLIDSITNSAFFKWFNFSTSTLTFILIIAGIVILIYIRRKTKKRLREERPEPNRDIEERELSQTFEIHDTK